MADEQQPAVQRPRADQGAINAGQVVLPQVEPPAAAEPAPLPQENPNPPPEQLEVFLYFLVLLFPRFSFFPLVFFYFILACTRFYLDLPSYLLASYLMSFIFVFCFVVCASCWLYSFRHCHVFTRVFHTFPVAFSAPLCFSFLGLLVQFSLYFSFHCILRAFCFIFFLVLSSFYFSVIRLVPSVIKVLISSG